MDESGSGEDMEEDDIEFELDPTCCLMCDKKHKTLEKCMVICISSMGSSFLISSTSRILKGS